MTTVLEDQSATSDSQNDAADFDATAAVPDAGFASERALQILKVLNELFDQSERDDA